MKNFTLKIKQLFAAMMMLACIPASAQFKATVEQYANTDYSAVTAEFTLTEVATALQTDTATLAAALNAWYYYDSESGAEKPADMFFLKAGDALVADYNTNAPGGFWMTRECGLGSYGVDAVFYEDIWFDVAEDFFGIQLGQFPDSLAAGATLTPSFVLAYGDKQATFDITYVVKPLPETPAVELDITKLEIVGNAEVTVEQYPRINYNSSAVYVNIAGAAAKLGIDNELLSLILTKSLYKARVDETYQTKIDSLTLATENGGWGREVLDMATGDTLPEVCAAPWSDKDQYYMDTWAFDPATDTLSCYIGQYPYNLQAGDKYYTNVYIVYGSKAFVVKYNVNIVEDPNAVNGDLASMTKMGESIIRIEQNPTTDYSTSAINLNVDSIAGVLGCATGDMTLMAIDNKGELSTSSTANNGGYWMTQGGIICAWGDNAYFFVEPAASNDYSQLNVGQMPGNTAVGEEGKTLLYLVAGNNYYVLDITLAIVEAQKSEVEFESVATRSYVVEALDETYVWSTQSANIPYAQIEELIGTAAPVLYALNIDSIAEQTGEKYTKDYTMGEKPGFWVTEDGRKNGWGNGSPWGITGLNSTDENFVIQCIQMDGFGVVGDSYTGQFFLVNEETGKMITINLTYKIVETLTEVEIVGEEWINLPVSMNDALVDYDFAKVATALGLETVDALFEGYYAKGMKADGTYSDGVDAVGSGLSFNTSGAYEAYASIGVLVSEDFTQFLTYSNDDIEAPFKAEATMCFEIDAKRYVIHITLLDSASYEAGIEGISANKKDGKIYNLQGQEVAVPAHGIYIQNGKKVVIK